MDAEREAYAELAEVAAQWRRLGEWDRQQREIRALTAAVRKLRPTNGWPAPPRVNGRSLELTDTWPGVAPPPACNDEPIPLVTVRRMKRPLARILSSFLGCRRSSQTGG